MKRAAIIFAGIGFGLFLTWLSLYLGSHITWHRAPGPGGCFDRGDCPPWAVPALAGYVLLFPALFGALNGIAWGRWPVRKWSTWFAILTLLTALVHLAGYAVPR